MWANAQRDGRPAEYTWRHLFNAAVWLCSNAAKTRKCPLKFAGCPKLTKRSQPLVGRSSPYCKGMWGRYCCLTIFFRLSIHALVVETDRKRISRFRPKTKTGRKWNFIFGPKPKRKRKRNSVVQVTTCDKVMYYCVNTQMMQHKYKITKSLDTKIEYCSEG